MSDYTDLMPPLSKEEFEALKSDIAERGVLVPIEVDEEGVILDGHHRYRACVELGIEDYPKVVREGLSEAEKRTHALRLNLARRHLSRSQRRALIREYLELHSELSDREIARRLGTTHPTVGSVRLELEDPGLVKFTTDLNAYFEKCRAWKEDVSRREEKASLEDGGAPYPLALYVELEAIIQGSEALASEGKALQLRKRKLELEDERP